MSDARHKSSPNAKTCPVCGKVLPPPKGPGPAMKFDRPSCRSRCWAINNSAKNAEHKRRSERKRRTENPELYKGAKRESHRRWRLKNKDLEIQRCRQYRAENPSHAKDYASKYRAKMILDNPTGYRKMKSECERRRRISSPDKFKRLEECRTNERRFARNCKRALKLGILTIDQINELFQKRRNREH